MSAVSGMEIPELIGVSWFKLYIIIMPCHHRLLQHGCYVCNTNFCVLIIVMTLKLSSTIRPLSGKIDDHESFAHATFRDLSWECM